MFFFLAPARYYLQLLPSPASSGLRADMCFVFWVYFLWPLLAATYNWFLLLTTTYEYFTRRSTAKHSTALPTTAQYSTARNGTAQHTKAEIDSYDPYPCARGRAHACHLLFLDRAQYWEAGPPPPLPSTALFHCTPPVPGGF